MAWHRMACVTLCGMWLPGLVGATENKRTDLCWQPNRKNLEGNPYTEADYQQASRQRNGYPKPEE